jgi:RimJ/RimL family protein N-acetyltransferase
MGKPASSRVELVVPFPSEQLRRAYEWVHQAGERAEHDDSPASAELYELYTGLQLTLGASYGIRRAGSNGDLIGLLYCEYAGSRNGYLHIAMAREAWGRGLADEAAALCIRDLFGRFPGLLRLSAVIMESNLPAQSLTRRMGFREEATLAGMVLQGGIPRAVVHFGLTRRDWERRNAVNPTDESGGDDGRSR